MSAMTTTPEQWQHLGRLLAAHRISCPDELRTNVELTSTV